MTIVTRLAVFFATNPDEELSAQDIAVKYGVIQKNIDQALKRAELNGWVSKTLKPDPTSSKKKRFFYTAGPRLLKEISR
jgi:hypothetical protein